MKSVKDVKRVLGARAPRSQGVLSHAAEFSTVNGVNDVNVMNDDWKARAPRSQGARSHTAEESTVNGVNDVNAMNDDWKVVRRGRKAPSRGVRRT